MSAASSPVEKIIHKTGESPFSIHRTILPPGETNALYLHCHPEAEFFYLEEGTLMFTVENHSFPLNAGDGIFVPPGLLHNAARTRQLNEPCSYYAAVFQPFHLEKLFSKGTPYFQALYGNRTDCIYVIKKEKTENQSLLSALSCVFRYYNCPPESCELAVHGALLMCWQELYNCHLSRLAVPAESESLRIGVQKALDYIWAHYGEMVTLAELADAAGFSESYFCRSFKGFTGYTPFDYLNRARVIKSCELLSQTGKKIIEIAGLCGFNNVSYS